jgi:chromosome segregation ATPase
MPETRKYETNEMVDIDNSGPEVDVTLPEEKKEEVKDEKVVESNESIIEEVKTEEPQSEKETEQKTEEPVKEKEEVKKEIKVQEDKSSEDKKELEEYSEGVKKRIAKLTKKMREAERQKEAALEYAKGVKAEADKTKSKLSTMEPGYMTAMEGRVTSGLEAAAAKLAAAREAGDLKAEIEAQKQIAKLGLEEARVELMKKRAEAESKQKPVKQPSLNEAIQPKTTAPDPRAEAWAEKNEWFGKDNAMTYTAFDLHKKLTEEEGMGNN